MRNFQILDVVESDKETGIIHLSVKEDNGMHPQVSMRREGTYVAISASFGLMEIALRPRFQELARALARLSPIKGLQTSRQVGTGQAYLAIGLQKNGQLVMRPTIVADATGHLSFNLVLTDEVRKIVFDWLPIDEVD